tara:strand:+ start:63 stop:293 length:231 start_codon:yes stop_codon:yes gene_type:complete
MLSFQDLLKWIVKELKVKLIMEGKAWQQVLVVFLEAKANLGAKDLEKEAYEVRDRAEETSEVKALEKVKIMVKVQT